MPQLFQVLRCSICLVFQVHQTKKSIKWECKLCGEKQSVKRHYGLGTAKDCRIHVQKLNGMRGEIDELKKNCDQDSENSDNETPTIKDKYQPIKESKWSNYIEKTETVEENSNETMSLGGAKVVLEIPKKRRKQFHNNIKKQPEVITPDDHKIIQESFKNDNASLKVTPISICNNMCIPSKITKRDLLPGQPTTEEECFKRKNTIKKKFVPLVLNKTSKWAQFTEDGEESEETDGMAPTPSIETSQNNLLFSLCDDSDLDNVLNI